jgi:hypothetical protein
MAQRVAYQGAKFAIVFAVEKSGACPGFDFFDGLGLPHKAKLMVLFQMAGDHGPIHNLEKFGDFGDGLFEFKSFQIRMPFAYAKNKRGAMID